MLVLVNVNVPENIDFYSGYVHVHVHVHVYEHVHVEFCLASLEVSGFSIGILSAVLERNSHRVSFQLLGCVLEP